MVLGACCVLFVCCVHWCCCVCVHGGLLVDVLDKNREIKSCFEYCKLDPTNYLTAPGLAWEAMLFNKGSKARSYHTC